MVEHLHPMRCGKSPQMQFANPTLSVLRIRMLNLAQLGLQFNMILCCNLFLCRPQFCNLLKCHPLLALQNLISGYTLRVQIDIVYVRSYARGYISKRFLLDIRFRSEPSKIETCTRIQCFIHQGFTR